MISPRNQVNVSNLSGEQLQYVDTLFELCDAEFNSRADIHNAFDKTAGIRSFARYVLLHKVVQVAQANDIYCCHHMAHIIALRLAEVWQAQREPT